MIVIIYLCSVVHPYDLLHFIIYWAFKFIQQDYKKMFEMAMIKSLLIGIFEKYVQFSNRVLKFHTVVTLILI